MNQSRITTAGPAGSHPHPVIVLRDQLTQTITAASQLRSILATADDPGRRLGKRR